MAHDREDGPGDDGEQGQGYRQVNSKGSCLRQQVAAQRLEEQQGQQANGQGNLLPDK
ncbi:hypothetical protein D3C78_1989440 [compost metagenome]